jgi:hypothetical protein
MLFPDGTEAIDIIKAALTPEEFIGYCKGNCLKYRLRAGKKDDLQQDIDKAGTYVDMIPRNETTIKRELQHCGPLADCSKCPSPCS